MSEKVKRRKINFVVKKHIWSVILGKLRLCTLKKVSLLSKRMLALARQEMCKDNLIVIAQNPDGLYLNDKVHFPFIYALQCYEKDFFVELMKSRPKTYDMIQHLILHNNSDYDLPVLPTNLLGLELCDMFNGRLDNLPGKLEYLDLGPLFDCQIDFLPATIKYLRLGTKFNKPIQKLPESLEKLKFDIWSNFNHPLPEIPANLSYIEYPMRYRQPIPKDFTHNSADLYGVFIRYPGI